MNMEADCYRTISHPAEAVYKEKGSKFLAFAFPVSDEETIRILLDDLAKKYYDATHHCYAWRLGPQGKEYRTNDNGEPSGTAGKPILGQMLSREVTELLIVVVRYFGGTKLGVSGLINAYKTAAAAVLDEADIVMKTVDAWLEITFSYLAMNDVMRVIKEMQPKITEQQFDNTCRMLLAIRRNQEERLVTKLTDAGAGIEPLGYK